MVCNNATARRWRVVNYLLRRAEMMHCFSY